MSIVGPDLYGGTTGIALFLAAFARVARDEATRQLALDVLAPVRRVLGAMVAEPHRAGPQLGVGGMHGLGAFVYALVRIGSLVEEPALVREAHAVSTLITPERLANDQVMDVISGSAGSLLALLALDAAAPEENAAGYTPLDLAEAAGRLLLTRQSRHEGFSGKAWVTRRGRPPLTGFSHGAAGICYSLLRLFERTRNAAYLEAACEGISYERSVFVPSRANWRDMRFDDVRCGGSWCHGAPGIALARAAGLPVLDDSQVRSELRIGLEKTRSLDLSDLDHVCCGNLGRVEILHRTDGTLEDFAGEAASLAVAGRVLDRAEARGHYRWHPASEEPHFDPGFFTGAAGAGYALLRLAADGGLPSVLLLE